MTLYEIDKEILDCIDLETGEVIDPEKLTDLQMEREKKIENVALWVKNLKAELEAVKAEKEEFVRREKSIKARIDGLSKWLGFALGWKKFSTIRCMISFRKSESVEIEDESKVPEVFLNKKVTYSPDKTAIKDAIKGGEKINGCKLVENQNIQIK